MSSSNVLDHKYTEEKVKAALEEWADDAKKEPKLCSIESRLMNNSNVTKTNIIIYRKYPLYERFTFPSHYYMTIDDKIWHPGYGDDMNIFQTKTPGSDEGLRHGIIEMKEKCNYCVYWELYRNFQSDRNFNIMVNNCQVIMGMFAETICILIIIVAVVSGAITGHYAFMLLFIFLFCVLLIFSSTTHCRDKYTFSTCPHIKPIREY
ncbi:Ac81-like protein [Musca domestica salivary gland hypertrophy virus]|uniref:Ac81-like protein n=1 Tax=Musca hytrovirus(isolate Musca domestica/United States/Boucias/-) TaxID=523909 RepID=B2YG85_MHVB|nr:Ac81-like protein [Musca domestica salivary gland hypertrophy virus]ACD03567.1 Ac81-like protein [Musca domestica salivary gland hypertrophy virus]